MDALIMTSIKYVEKVLDFNWIEPGLSCNGVGYFNHSTKALTLTVHKVVFIGQNGKKILLHDIFGLVLTAAIEC